MVIKIGMKELAIIHGTIQRPIANKTFHVLPGEGNVRERAVRACRRRDSCVAGVCFWGLYGLMKSSSPRRLLVSTRNLHKVAEIREILGREFDVLDLSAVSGVGEVEETGTTFEENAALKALAASERFDGWVVADDSGLEVDHLGGAPGVLSARFSGQGATDASNRELLLAKLAGAEGRERAARFRCVMVLARGNKKLAAFTGSVEGLITRTEKGAGGFGYDSLFVPDGHDKTFAELGADVKNTMSHRARALRELLAWSGWGPGDASPEIKTGGN